MSPQTLRLKYLAREVFVKFSLQLSDSRRQITKYLPFAKFKLTLSSITVISISFLPTLPLPNHTLR